MPRARAARSLELNEDERALWREWRFERGGWGVIALVLAAGFAGLFGDGALAAASATSADGATVARYERIVRHGAPSDITLRLAPGTGRDSIVIVSLDEEYLRDVDVLHVSPEPLRVRAAAGRVEYHLLRLDPSRPMTVVLSVEPGAAGKRHAVVGTDEGTLDLRQLVLP